MKIEKNVRIPAGMELLRSDHEFKTTLGYDGEHYYHIRDYFVSDTEGENETCIGTLDEVRNYIEGIIFADNNLLQTTKGTDALSMEARIKVFNHMTMERYLRSLLDEAETANHSNEDVA